MGEPDEQPIPWVEDSEDGEVTVGAVHGPSPAPTRYVTVQSPDGTTAQQVVSEAAWQRHEALRKAGYSRISTSNRKETRRLKAEARRTTRRESRQGGRPAT